jgi:intraflagellar transport protein 74
MGTAMRMRQGTAAR